MSTPWVPTPTFSGRRDSTTLPPHAVPVTGFEKCEGPHWGVSALSRPRTFGQTRASTMAARQLSPPGMAPQSDDGKTATFPAARLDGSIGMPAISRPRISVSSPSPIAPPMSGSRAASVVHSASVPMLQSRGAHLDDLLLFTLVVDAGGFSAAERQTGIAKSRLSRRVATLERALGVRLLHRSGQAQSGSRNGGWRWRRHPQRARECGP